MKKACLSAALIGRHPQPNNVQHVQLKKLKIVTPYRSIRRSSTSTSNGMKALHTSFQPFKTKRTPTESDIPMSSSATSRNSDHGLTDPSSPLPTIVSVSTSTPHSPSSNQPPVGPQPAHIFLSYPSQHQTSVISTMPFLPPPFLSIFINYHPMKSPVNILLLFIPLGIAAGALKFRSDVLIFSLNLLAIIPLAPLMRLAKKELARGLGRTAGGLVNVGLGNGVLWIVAIIAVSRGQILIVQSSLVGSILFESLLLLGSSILFTSYGKENVKFEKTLTNIMSSLMMVTSVSLLVPTTMSPWDSSDDTLVADMGNDILIVSRSTAIILLALFIAYLYFQLKTHRLLFLDPPDNPSTSDQESIYQPAAEEDQGAILSPWAALGVLIAAVFCTIWCASYLINSIDGLAKFLNIGKTFIGLVLIPAMGNIAKFATSLGNKMDFTVRAIIGSVLQITLLITPFLVLLGWVIDQPMILSFDVFEAAVFLLAIMVVNYIIQDGKTNYFEGFMLMGTYIIIVAAFYIRPDPAEKVLGLGLELPNLERSEAVELH